MVGRFVGFGREVWTGVEPSGGVVVDVGVLGEFANDEPAPSVSRDRGLKQGAGKEGNNLSEFHAEVVGGVVW